MENKEAIQITWGDGRIRMNRFKDHADGSFGLLLVDVGEGHKPGDVAEGPDEEEHIPQPGEIYLRFKNKAGLRALLFSLIELATDDEK